MPFEKFESTGSGRGGGSKGPMISLRKSGSLGINRAAMEEYFEGAEAAVMYFDEEENEVGIEPVEDSDKEGAYTISESDGTGSITPSAFLNRYGLTPSITEQYTPRVHKENQHKELVVFEIGGEESQDFIGTYGSPSDEEGEAAEADD